MTNSFIDNISDLRTLAISAASRIRVLGELGNPDQAPNLLLIESAAEALETAVVGTLSQNHFTEEDTDQIKVNASDAYKLYRVLPLGNQPIRNLELTLRKCTLAVIGDLSADAARELKDSGWPEVSSIGDSWGDKTWCTTIDVWLRLIRKDGWSDRDAVLEGVSNLRNLQSEFESSYLNDSEPQYAKENALKLIATYHLAKAAEILALYITNGEYEDSFNVQPALDMHFDKALRVISSTSFYYLESSVLLLQAAAAQLVKNSIWTVTRAVNSRVTGFVNELVNRGRGQNAIFDMLPPQRRALAEKGLLGSSRRAVVLSLPTSSGKTLIAQFRILQALNQFDKEEGWVAYLAPTRALVRQVTRRLRKDFSPLGINVEQVSPALEIDSFESDLLTNKSNESGFQVLVTTPEKLDLMLRQDWEQAIGRPLTLVVVDEAHGIQDYTRGLRLELLLATINSECKHAQFLLLTPFIKNAKEVAQWLGGDNSDDISLSLDWQPNDRVIGISSPIKGSPLNKKSFDYDLYFKSIHTSRNTLFIDDTLKITPKSDKKKTFSQVNCPKVIAAETAAFLSSRGPLIVMHQQPRWVWSLADCLKSYTSKTNSISKDVKLVQDYIRSEMGENFPLAELLEYKIGVHHGGLSDDSRTLMEWLFERGELDFLVATTTLAQGVNFPVAGVVMASNHYPLSGPMPLEDFWNIAGRAGRVDQGDIGVVAIAADNEDKARQLEGYVKEGVGELNSALIALVSEAIDLIDDLESIVYYRPEWSSFLQYLAHTYNELGSPDNFPDQIEKVLRGTYGFDRLRRSDKQNANRLLDGVRRYAGYLSGPKMPTKLVDSTGFSLQSIRSAMYESSQQGLNKDSWDPATLFVNESQELRKMMGVLLRVPELRENLEAATGGASPDGNKLASIIKAWVSGDSIPEIAKEYFSNGDKDLVESMTACGQSLYGKLTQTTAWGLGALLSITGGDLSDEEFHSLSNLASRVFYGVPNDEAIALRMLGVPRMAASALAQKLNSTSLPEMRQELADLDQKSWSKALGNREKGATYHRVWRILEGLE
ncbi:MAG: DEAD/DEAH box helicase [Pseudomonadales bacterium]|nr:DEAD/DEAH box helicase [Pseudomonadales bacterium]